MGIRKFRLLMSKYGFSIAIILIELFLVFGIILYMSQIAPIIWVTLVFLISVATYSDCESFDDTREQGDLVDCDLCACIWSTALSHVR